MFCQYSIRKGEGFVLLGKGNRQTCPGEKCHEPEARPRDLGRQVRVAVPDPLQNGPDAGHGDEGNKNRIFIPVSPLARGKMNPPLEKAALRGSSCLGLEKLSFHPGGPEGNREWQDEQDGLLDEPSRKKAAQPFGFFSPVNCRRPRRLQKPSPALGGGVSGQAW